MAIWRRLSARSRGLERSASSPARKKKRLADNRLFKLSGRLRSLEIVAIVKLTPHESLSREAAR
ncbi:hypothetical protein AS156_36570 [Bradyrhizobium macuxiense]|uniref:Uncharacterized protein n=1 Tax=Bradyrhizobium macuxiense TaxID=1755647 RepID=A0A109K086_9BRAD|nr:hypothetical protein AS156_36570 [Bradyrhizobium macuxiense]